MKTVFQILSFLILFSSCKSNLEDESIFPEVKNITELKNTDFIPTFESSFNIEHNIIYGATIPLAWDEIKNQIGTPLSKFTNKELEELNNSKSYVNVLLENEYETSVEVDENIIRAKAYFRKSLPFEEPLTKFDEYLKFKKSEVESFGFWGNCSFAKINYFNNENDFSISLLPENQEHEIILIMYQERKNIFGDFKEYFGRYNQQKNLGKNQNIYFIDEDKVQIPIIEFNLQKTFNEIIGSKFYSETNEYQVDEMQQRNAFILNENGAEVESEAEFAVEEASEELNKPKPKMMIFNKPFVVFLKRKDAENPYFGVYIANDELLKRNKNYR